jgi:predicted enzyme related to lactoylglutathione lyase
VRLTDTWDTDPGTSNYCLAMGSLIVFSVDVRRLADFYEAVLGVTPTNEGSGDIRLRSDGEEVLIHSIPERIAKTISIQSPPEAREGSPIKPAFDVDSLQAALEVVERNGGVVTGRTFSMNGLTRHDVLDPDGNVIQLRSSNS